MIRSNELFLVAKVKWDEALANLDYSAILSRFEASPGFYICRPTWPTIGDRDRWLQRTEAHAIDAIGERGEIHFKTQQNDYMR